MVDKRLFHQHPQIVLPQLNLSHGEISEYDRNTPQAGVYSMKISLDEWPGWKRMLLGELDRIGSGARDLPVFDDDVLGFFRSIVPDYEDPKLSLPPDEQLAMTRGYTHYILRPKTIFTEAMVNQMVYLYAPGGQSRTDTLYSKTT